MLSTTCPSSGPDDASLRRSPRTLRRPLFLRLLISQSLDTLTLRWPLTDLAFANAIKSLVSRRKPNRCQRVSLKNKLSFVSHPDLVDRTLHRTGSLPRVSAPSQSLHSTRRSRHDPVTAIVLLRQCTPILVTASHQRSDGIRLVLIHRTTVFCVRSATATI